MRHIHYLAALVLLVLLATFVSCTKESCSESETLPKFLYTYDDVGRLHNEGLDLPAGYPTTKSGISETENLEASMSDLGITYRDSLLSIIGSSKTELEVNCWNS